MERKRLALGILIAAQVFVFAWFGLDKLRNPLLWTGFLPPSLDGFFGVGGDSWIVVIGLIELLLALLLLVPVRRVRQAAAVLIALHLAGVLTQVGWNDVGARDIGLLLSDLATLILL